MAKIANPYKKLLFLKPKTGREYKICYGRRYRFGRRKKGNRTTLKVGDEPVGASKKKKTEGKVRIK